MNQNTMIHKLPTGRTVHCSVVMVEVAPCEFHYCLCHDCNFGVDEQGNMLEHDRYLWVWNAASDTARKATIRSIGVMAGTPGVQFDWYDAAVVIQFLNRAAMPLDPESYIGREEPNYPF